MGKIQSISAYIEEVEKLTKNIGEDTIIVYRGEEKLYPTFCQPNLFRDDYFKNNKSSWYEMPKGVVGVLVNPITGEIAKTNDEPKRILYYVRGTEPN